MNDAIRIAGSMKGCNGSFDRNVGYTPDYKHKPIEKAIKSACNEFYRAGDALESWLDSFRGAHIDLAWAHLEEGLLHLRTATGHINRLTG